MPKGNSRKSKLDFGASVRKPCEYGDQGRHCVFPWGEIDAATDNSGSCAYLYRDCRDDRFLLGGVGCLKK